jgi:hypothetical protein
VPPVRVAVRVWGCEVVSAELCGERATVTLEVGGGSGVTDGGVVVGDELAPPPPQEDNSAAVMARINILPFVRGIDRGTDKERLRCADSI